VSTELRRQTCAEPFAPKSRKHLEENVRAADIVLTADDLAEIDRIVPPGSASGTRYPIGQMHRVNL